MGLLASVFSIFSCFGQKAEFRSVDVDEFEKTISDTSVIRLDVRTADEFCQGHIENARNIDVLKDNFKDSAASLLPKNSRIAVYCRSGRRSKKAAQILSSLGYEIVDLDSGYIGWSQAGKKTVK